MPRAARTVKRAAAGRRLRQVKFPAQLGVFALFVSNWPRPLAFHRGEAGLNIRATLTLAATGAVLAACASAPAHPPQVTAGAEAVGHSIDEIAAANGPPSRQWTLPDGRKAYQWQTASITARVGADPSGEIQGAASQTTCFYTFYAKPEAKGFVVVGAEPARPGCLKLAMNGMAK